MPRTEGLGVAEEKEEEEEGRGQSLLEQHRTKQSKQAKSKGERREERRRREEAEAIEKEERLKKVDRRVHSAYSVMCGEFEQSASWTYPPPLTGLH